MKPVILITSYYVNRNEIEGTPIRGKKEQDLAVCTYDYINAVEKAGGVPLVMPNLTDSEAVQRVFELADGFLFSGGEDMDPSWYREEISEDNVIVADERRDNFEMKLAELVLQSNKPVLGICRGMQLLNVAGGGSLYQDLKSSIPHPGHEVPKNKKTHEITILEDSKLYHIYQETQKAVNSFHHQGVKKLADCYAATAFAEDGLVEAYESKDERFLIGVQWHPEMLHESYEEELKIFKALVKSATK